MTIKIDQVIEIAKEYGFKCSRRTIVRYRKGFYWFGKKQMWYFDSHLRLPTSADSINGKGYEYSEDAVRGFFKQLLDVKQKKKVHA